MAIWSRLTSFIAGGAIAGAGTAAARPALEVPTQKAWANAPNRVFDIGRLAELVAQGLIGEGAVVDEAHRTGYSENKLRALIQATLEAPPYSEVLDLWRRNATRPADEQISDEQVNHALAKAKIEEQYWPALKELINARLPAPEIALAIVRGLIADPGILPVAPPTATGKVPAFPTFNIDALAEAASTGFDRERLSVYVGTMGRPMAVNEAARATFREIIERVDFDRAIAEGDIRNEWRDALFDVAREILSANQYAELELRGFYDRTTRLANTAKHGMSQEDSDWLYDVLGRAPGIHAVTTGLARGGTYDGLPKDIPEPWKSAVQRGNVRPEWYSLEYANRYSLPTAFVFRQLLKDGAITPAQGEQYFLELGWPPDLAKLVADHYGQPTAAPADKHITSAQTRTITAIMHAYLGGQLTDAGAESQLVQAGLSSSSAQGVVAQWSQQKAVNAIPPVA